MRIAVLVIGLFLGVIVFLQACTATALSGVAESEDSTAAGVFVPLFFVVGSAFALRHPKVSVWAFIIAAGWAFLVAASSIYQDMWVWGFLSIILAIMSWFGHRGKLEEDREAMAEKQRQMNRDRMLEEMMMRERRGGQ